MAKEKISPLEPRKFFNGVWRGEGELIPGVLNSWFIPKERIRLESRPLWLSETIWKVEESFEFSSGRIIERKMFAELVAPDKIHVTADDMPQGADIILRADGFRFTPYHILGEFGGIKWRLRCTDDNRLDETGTIHDRIKMFYLGLPVAEMRLTVKVDR